MLVLVAVAAALSETDVEMLLLGEGAHISPAVVAAHKNFDVGAQLPKMIAADALLKVPAFHAWASLKTGSALKKAEDAKALAEQDLSTKKEAYSTKKGLVENAYNLVMISLRGVTSLLANIKGTSRGFSMCMYRWEYPFLGVLKDVYGVDSPTTTRIYALRSYRRRRKKSIDPIILNLGQRLDVKAAAATVKTQCAVLLSRMKKPDGSMLVCDLKVCPICPTGEGRPVGVLHDSHLRSAVLWLRSECSEHAAPRPGAPPEAADLQIENDGEAQIMPVVPHPPTSHPTLLPSSSSPRKPVDGRETTRCLWHVVLNS
jgi:hypothetical protein